MSLIRDLDEIVNMITLKELLKGKDFNLLPKEHQDNLLILLERINKVRIAYGKQFLVTSGYRSMEDHLGIYNRKGITDINKIPVKSKHLFGLACDLADPKKELQTWCRNNQDILRNLGIWMEDFRYSSTWVHFQCAPYGSYKEGGSLWFIP